MNQLIYLKIRVTSWSTSFHLASFKHQVKGRGRGKGKRKIRGKRERKVVALTGLEVVEKHPVLKRGTRRYLFGTMVFT